MMKQTLWDVLASGPKHTLYGTQFVHHFLTNYTITNLLGYFLENGMSVTLLFCIQNVLICISVCLCVDITGISQSERMRRVVKTLSEGRGVVHKLLPLKPPLEMPKNKTNCGMVWKFCEV